MAARDLNSLYSYLAGKLSVQPKAAQCCWRGRARSRNYESIWRKNQTFPERPVWVNILRGERRRSLRRCGRRIFEYSEA